MAARRATVTGVSSTEANTLLNSYNKYKESPLVYHHNGRAVASLVFIWLGYPFVVYSTVIMWLSLAHDKRTGGPWSTHARQEKGAFAKDIEIGSLNGGDDRNGSVIPAAAAPTTSTGAARYDGAADVPSDHAHYAPETSSTTAVPAAAYDPTYKPLNVEGGATKPYPGT